MSNYKSITLALALFCAQLFAQGQIINFGGSAVGGATKAVLASNYTNATTTLSNLTAMSFAVAANTNYVIVCYLVHSVDTNTATPNWAFTWPASPTTAMWSGFQTGTIGATTNLIAPVTTSGTASATSTTTTITVNDSAALFFTLQNGANAGTVQLQAKANGAGTLTVLAGSMCLLN